MLECWRWRGGIRVAICIGYRIVYLADSSCGVMEWSSAVMLWIEAFGLVTRFERLAL